MRTLTSGYKLKEQSLADTHFTTTQLKERNWTDSLIRKMLGNADELRPNPRYASAAPMKFWARKRVITVEESESWKELLAKSSTRREAAERATQTKRQRLLEYVDGLIIEVDAISLQEVTDKAIAEFNEVKGEMARAREDYEFREATLDSDPSFLERITVNHLRHQASNYDEELGQIWGKVGVGDAYRLLNNKVYDAIAASYPSLAIECRRQMERKD